MARLVTLLAAGLLGGALLVPPAGAVTLRGTVTAVVDGDTVKVEARGFETTVRLVGIDTPETRHPTAGVQCFGPRASAMTRRMLPRGIAVRLETDPSQDVRDRYGRLVAYVYTGGRSGARGSVNFALVARGAAKVYVYGGTPFRFTPTFRRGEAKARRAGNGLWGPPCRGDTTRRDPSWRPAGPPGGAGRPPTVGDYSPALPAHPPDLDCDDVEGPVRVGADDPHGLDADRDGVACA